MREYPKIIYPEGNDPVRVKSFDEAMEILNDERLIDRMPGEKVEKKENKKKKETPKKTQDEVEKFKCRWCGKEYIKLNKRFLKPHEQKCEKNPENE